MCSAAATPARDRLSTSLPMRAGASIRMYLVRLCSLPLAYRLCCSAIRIGRRGRRRYNFNLQKKFPWIVQNARVPHRAELFCVCRLLHQVEQGQFDCIEVQPYFRISRSAARCAAADPNRVASARSKGCRTSATLKMTEHRDTGFLFQNFCNFAADDICYATETSCA